MYKVDIITNENSVLCGDLHGKGIQKGGEICTHIYICVCVCVCMGILRAVVHEVSRVGHNLET